MTKTALITGSSGGIGQELAFLFAKDGHNLVLVARNKEKLQSIAHIIQQTYSVQVTVIKKDLENPASAYELYDEILTKQIQIDYLVNNAGYGLYGAFSSTDLSKEVNMIELNITSLTILSKLFLRPMLEKQSGGILNVASTASFQPGPLMAVYYATKAYVLSFTEALASEVINTGVHVSALCPGPTKTGFGDRADLGNSKIFESGLMNVKKVALDGYLGFMKNKTIIIPGVQNQLLAQSSRFLPRKWVASIVKHIQGTRSNS